jgi:cyclophilin family peptidyl-prolyl cis-trans isomerase
MEMAAAFKTAAILLGLALTGCASVPQSSPILLIETELGRIRANLDVTAAPGAGCAFLSRVGRGDYNGGEFFRSSASLGDDEGRLSLGLIQAGTGPANRGATEPESAQQDETRPLVLGSLALGIHEDRPDTTSFFIVTEAPLAAASREDDFRFVVVGRIVDGLQAAKAISWRERSASGQFLTPVRIDRMAATGSVSGCRAPG